MLSSSHGISSMARYGIAYGSPLLKQALPCMATAMLRIGGRQFSIRYLHNEALHKSYASRNLGQSHRFNSATLQPSSLFAPQIVKTEGIFSKNYRTERSRNEIVQPTMQKRHYRRSFSDAEGYMNVVGTGCLLGIATVVVLRIYDAVSEKIRFYRQEKQRELNLMLRDAVENDDIKAVEKCLDRGAKANWGGERSRGEYYAPAFKRACRNGNMKMIELMLKKQKNSCDLSVIKKFAREYSHYQNSDKIIRLLIEHGARPDFYCLRYALERNDFELYKMCFWEAGYEDKNDDRLKCMPNKKEFDDRILYSTQATS